MTKHTLAEDRYHSSQPAPHCIYTAQDRAIMDKLFGSSAALDEAQAIRGLNKDFTELNCAAEDSLPCQNLRAAMRKLGLAAERPAPPAVALNKPGVVTPPPLLVPQASTDAVFAFEGACGVVDAERHEAAADGVAAGSPLLPVAPGPLLLGRHSRAKVGCHVASRESVSSQIHQPEALFEKQQQRDSVRDFF